MNNTDDTQELQKSTSTEDNSSNADKLIKIKEQAPLMRYFDLIDESTESFILGYN